MLLFEKNFIRRVPKINERSRFSSPVYRLAASVSGTLAVSVYQVRPSTRPSPGGQPCAVGGRVLYTGDKKLPPCHRHSPQHRRRAA